MIKATRERAGAHRMMRLQDIVKKYLEIGGGYGKAVALASFGLPKTEAEELFSALDEDYHISRFLHFTKGSGIAYSIGGFPQTHISIDAGIRGSLAQAAEG